MLGSNKPQKKVNQITGIENDQGVYVVVREGLLQQIALAQNSEKKIKEKSVSGARVVLAEVIKNANSLRSEDLHLRKQQEPVWLEPDEQVVEIKEMRGSYNLF